MANIINELNKIKNAIHGIEVRGSIHDGIKKINDEVEDATDLTDNTKNRQDAIEQQFDDLQQNYNEGTPSTAEVVAARTNTETSENYNTIGRRMDDEYKKVTSQLADIVINANNFELESGEDSDNGRLQRAIDYAHSLLGTYDKKIKVNFGSHIYTITGLIVPRGISLTGNATLNLVGEYNTALTYHSIHSFSEGFKINLTKKGQTGIELQSGESINTQLNSFKNVWVEGNAIEDTTGLKIGKTWTNSFYNCYFLRCADGVVFNDSDSNANFFYGCEIRHTKAHENSKMAILHLNGKNNAFIGGVIETYQDGVDVRGGTLTLDNVYTEDFQVDRPFHLRGDGIFKMLNCLIKGKFQINGGKTLLLLCNDLSRGAINTNNNSPLIRFDADVDTEVICDGNTIPLSMIHARYGMWNDAGKWLERSVENKKEKYLDRNKEYLTLFLGESNVTGDGTRHIAKLDIISNPYLEVTNDFEFNAISDGIYKIDANIRLEGINDTFGNITFYLREKGTGGREFVIDSSHSRARDGNGRIMLRGSFMVELKNTLPVEFLVRVDGSSRTIGIMSSTNSSIHGMCSIERIS